MNKCEKKGMRQTAQKSLVCCKCRGKMIRYCSTIQAHTFGGKQMDNFMDKIAKKLNSQEVIRANMAADAAQLEKLEQQVAEYDGYVQDMRRLNLRNAENEQKLKALLEAGEGTLKESLSNYEQQLQRITEECLAKIQEISESEARGEAQELLGQIRASADEHMQQTTELFKQSDEFTHRENVKVYRNVQTVVVDELEKQNLMMTENMQALEAGNKKLFVLNIGVLILSAASLGLLIAHLTGLF